MRLPKVYQPTTVQSRRSNQSSSHFPHVQHAEGFGRYHYKENVQFCRIARGSACELMDHLMTYLDEDYIPTAQHEKLCQERGTFLRVLNVYIKAIGPSETSLNR